ncbi:MAG: hypothetical protein EPO21_07370 [Chloroflexota bacterium]|nr:MAG: hypothetical protein EPO21_07370 [Chloroflexota bacterium]
MSASVEHSVETVAASRPRFARELETLALRLPPGKKLGAVLAVARASNGDLFVFQQPNAQGTDPASMALPCWLPPIVHLTGDGEFINAWGGPDHIPAVDGVSQWPVGPEGLECDAEGNLWVFGWLSGDAAVLKFSPSGELLLRIGQRGRAGDDRDTQYLDRPTSCYHDIQTREVFVADGYGNHRVIAFNSDTGAFTRMWGCHGKDPYSLSPEEGFVIVHKVARGPNGRLYVADRTQCRVQEFELVPGGARFTREVTIAPGTMVFHTGSAWDISFAPGDRFMYVADGSNFRIWIVDLNGFKVLGSTTVHTEYENEINLPLHYNLVHRFAVEPSGDLLLACVNAGLKRLKFQGIR